MNIGSQIILAFDSSGVTCSAAVSKNGKITSSFYVNNGLTHSTTLLPAIKRVLDDSGVSVADIDAIAVTAGPGSFTGIKIGVATAKGLAFAKNTPCLSVSTTATFAVSAIAVSALAVSAFADEAESSESIICPVMDARRGMFYNALYARNAVQNKNNVLITRVSCDRQISGENLAEEIKDKNALIIGDGTELFAEYCEKNSIKIRKNGEILSGGGFRHIRAENIIEAVKCGFYEETDPKTLSAIYLRSPQAERERIEKLSGEKYM